MSCVSLSWDPGELFKRRDISWVRRTIVLYMLLFLGLIYFPFKPLARNVLFSISSLWISYIFPEGINIFKFISLHPINYPWLGYWLPLKHDLGYKLLSPCKMTCCNGNFIYIFIRTLIQVASLKNILKEIINN